ncbi:MAG: hypothetical protein AAF655_13505 [Bacteroidota bacterium]
MKLISTLENKVSFILHKTFSPALYLPISHYVSWKLENDWDDYNELYHAIQFMEKLNETEGIWYDIHSLEKYQKVRGVLTIVGGQLDKLELDENIDPRNSILLKYFHLIEKGQGYGSYWLKSVIIPHYANKGFQSINLSSSHPKSFPFYQRLGQEVTTCSKKSDNQLYDRICKTFCIPLKNQ